MRCIEVITCTSRRSLARSRMVVLMLSRISVRLPPTRAFTLIAVITSSRSSTVSRVHRLSSASFRLTPIWISCTTRSSSARVGWGASRATIARDWLRLKPPRSALTSSDSVSASCSLNRVLRRLRSEFSQSCGANRPTSSITGTSSSSRHTTTAARASSSGTATLISSHSATVKGRFACSSRRAIERAKPRLLIAVFSFSAISTRWRPGVRTSTP